MYAGTPDTANDGTFTASSDGTNLDWKIPLADDAESDPYCEPYSTEASDFACKKIKCITQRRLQTGDAFDFQFSPTATVPDKMIIKPGRAMLGMNKSGCTATTCQSMININSATGATSEISISIYQMGTMLKASLAAAAMGAAVLAF